MRRERTIKPTGWVGLRSALPSALLGTRWPMRNPSPSVAHEEPGSAKVQKQPPDFHTTHDGHTACFIRLSFINEVRPIVKMWGKLVAVGMLAACGTQTSSQGTTAVSQSNLAGHIGGMSVNGLSLNGLSTNGFSTNGLSTNGFSTNGLSTNGFSTNGLSTNGVKPGLFANWFNNADSGNIAMHAEMMQYLMKCALADGHSTSFKDKNGVTHTWTGLLGFADHWLTQTPTQEDKEWVSGCLLAHINSRGRHVPISIRANHPSISTTATELSLTATPVFGYETAFWGDLFSAAPVKQGCYGQTLEFSVNRIVNAPFPGVTEASFYGRDCIFPGFCSALIDSQGGCLRLSDGFATIPSDFSCVQNQDGTLNQWAQGTTFDYYSCTANARIWKHIVHIAAPAWMEFEHPANQVALPAGAEVVPCSGCSGKLGVVIAGGVTLPLSPIYVTAAGEALQLIIEYTNGSGGPLSAVVHAGDRTKTLSLPATGGWGVVGEVSVPFTTLGNYADSFSITATSAHFDGYYVTFQ